MINLRQSLEMATGSIFSSRMRSALTTLGIVIGVAAVIANVSLGASFNQYFDREIGTIGSNFIIVSGDEANLFTDNERNVIEKVPGVKRLSPVNSQVAQVSYMSASKRFEVIGITEDYKEIGKLELDRGNFIKDNDQYVAVIGSDIANERFDRKISLKNSIDLTFRTHDGEFITRTFIVKGILEEPEPTFIQTGMEPEASIFIPVSTLNEILGETGYGGFFIEAENMEVLSRTSDQIDGDLGRYFAIPSRDMDDEDLKPYTVFDQQELLEEAGGLSSGLTIMLTAVALISLIVGSIGIMNIMLVTVTERTSEIGLMKAIGYSNMDILSLFIVESAVIGTIGGVMGALLGCLGAYAVALYMNLPTAFPITQIILGFAVSVLVGLLAGAYPANKAAKMKPVDALRHN